MENSKKPIGIRIPAFAGVLSLLLLQFGCTSFPNRASIAAPPTQMSTDLVNKVMLPSGGGFDQTAVQPAVYQQVESGESNSAGLNPVTANPVTANPVQQAGYIEGTSYDNQVATTPSKRSIAHRFQSPQEKDLGTLFDPTTGKGVAQAGGAGPSKSQKIKDVVIVGNRRVPTAEIKRNLKTRIGRFLDPDILQQDVQAIWRMSTIRRVNGPYLKEQPDGVVVTFEVKEHPVIQSLRFVGNRVMTDAALRREIGLEIGKPLNDFEVRLARDKIQDVYKTKGYTHTHVELLKTNEPSKIVFNIYEDLPKKISAVTFDGNTVAPDGRLRAIISSKKQILGFFGGNFDRSQVDRDTEKLTAYYYSLGYFNARIGREIIKNPGSGKVELRFVINEGIRYRVRSLRFIGNQTYDASSLRTLVKLKPSKDGLPFFQKGQMEKDVNTLRDSYGSNGYIFAKIQAQPRFLEEPGQIDLVYKIEEGEVYRVGKINIHIEGDGITKRSVIWNRLIQKPGEVIDIRKIRQSERLLRASQLFGDPSDPSSRPKITVKPKGGPGTSIR